MLDKGWTWTEDRQWATSRIIRAVAWDNTIHWGLEARSERSLAGSMRLGEMVLVEYADERMTLRILSESGVQ